MASSSSPNHPREEDQEQWKSECRDAILSLPKEKGWITGHLYNYNGVWLSLNAALGLMLVQHHFKPQPTDIILATFLKSGTTWFKSLVFAIMNRTNFNFSTHPLLTSSPHECIPFLEAIIADIDPVSIPSPRLFATHMPFSSLPAIPITHKIVYVYRNPKDVVVSFWHFHKKLRSKDMPLLAIEEAFELFCKGVCHYGPYWDHVLGYWKASVEFPDKVLFLTYESMTDEPILIARRLAEFLGKPFSLEEERDGVVEQVVKLCSFQNLRSLEVNKSGVQEMAPQFFVHNSDFLRKGEVGDWKNHLTAEMARELDRITMDRFGGTDDLMFKALMSPP